MADSADSDLKETGKEIANGVARGLVNGLSNEKTAPIVAKVLCFMFAVILIISLCYILVPYFAKQTKDSNDANRYMIDSFDKELKTTTNAILEFDKTISSVNSNLAIMKAESDETRSEQKAIKDQLKDHEKRITKTELEIEGEYEHERKARSKSR